MEVHSWNKELILANAQFKRLFNNISIFKNGEEIKFKCILGNRSRIFKHLENPEKNSMYKLPLIIIERTGIVKNNDRLANINNEVKYSTHSSRFDYNLYTPIPIDITYEVTIVSKYQEHIDRAISNFIPFFNKDLYVRCQHPKFNNLCFTNQVVMEDSIQEEHNSEIDPTADDIIQTVCTFTFKTYMFCGNRVTRVPGYGMVYDTILSVDENDISTEIHIQYPQGTEKPDIDDIELSDIVEKEELPLIPQMNMMYVGFYPVPLLSHYIKYMDFVDTIPDDVIYMGIDDLSMTTSAEYYPYVDRFTWRFDELAPIE